MIIRTPQVKLNLSIFIWIKHGCISSHGVIALKEDEIGQKDIDSVIEAAKASCFDNYTYDDYMWYFDAWIYYPRRDYEKIVDVYVEVYDGPYIINWFPLYYDQDKYWTSSWIEGIETSLYCGDYYYNYEVDFIAVDYQGNFDVLTTTPYYWLCLSLEKI